MVGKKKWPKDEFTDLVFSWSRDEIFDKNLYKDQVEKIPDTFEDVDGYLESYVYPLLEETHSELASALETAFKAPFAEVTDISESKVEELVYDIKVDLWRNKTRDRDGTPYKTLPGDMLLITDKKPETERDIECVEWAYCFASVRSIDDDEDGGAITSFGFEVKTTVEIDVENIRGKSLYVIHLLNLTPNKRIWNALRMRRNLNVIERVLHRDDMLEESCEYCPRKSYFKMEDKLGSVMLSKLNESQKDAILATMSKVDCDHKASVELIWGPPGTGKTATLSILLYALLRMGVRTLVCAPTNVAITELASRVLALLMTTVEDEYEDCFPVCSLGDILIFGNKDNLKVGPEIEEIFLDYRVKSLSNCVLPMTGWKPSIVSMISFLDDVVSQHEVYVENELIIAESGISDDTPPPNIKPFLEFAREQFASIAASLRTSMETLVTHLPRLYIRYCNVRRITQLMLLLDSIEKLLFKDNSLTSDKLKSIFQQNEINVSEGSVNPTSLAHARSQCLSVLRHLKDSLSEVVSNRISSKDFCFQTAQLIFCTVSTSFKLHSVDMEPFKLLVIDEASQVKECELVISLQIPWVRHAILVGDECQLTATVSSTLSKKAGFERSLFERLSSLGHYKHLLDMQYRMHPEISRFPNKNIYNNQILDAPSVQSDDYEKTYIEGRMFGPFSFLDICEGKEEKDDVGHSKRNLVEVAVAVKIVQKLFKAWTSRSPKEKLNIGVISPYAAQVAAIRDKLHHKYANIGEFVVKVKSVDGFQGGEEDIIIISTVRSNTYGSIGFLDSPKRTNVALTRARHCLWVLGNARTLRKTGSIWEALIKDAERRECFFAADEDHDIGKTILDIKKELDQLDDLLNTDSILFQNSRWKVLFSDNFRKSFHKLKTSGVKKLAMDLLLRLANGWRPKKINVDWKCPSSLHNVKQFKFKDYYVICTIDLIKDSTYIQVLKIWDILPISEAPKLLKRLDSIFAMFTDDFVRHCNIKLLEGETEVPKSWSASKEIIRYKNKNGTESDSGIGDCAIDTRSFVENSKVNESLLLMKFYSLSTGTVNHLLSDLDGEEVDLPFEVTDEEREVIAFQKSSFILGRSGTGKTTILTMKLFQKLQQYTTVLQDVVDKTNESMETTLHQLFVTVSPKLCHAVRKHVSRLKRFVTGNIEGGYSVADAEDIDEMGEFKDIPDTFVGIKPETYPLIITLNKFLMMLDGTLGDSYFQRFRDVRSSSQIEGQRSIALETFIRNNEVTFDHFCSAYWPHFNSNLKKNLDPSRVYTEIMSHIKGGLLEGEDSDTKRSREAYIALSESRVSTLNAEKRDLIYNIFEDYERMKMDRTEFDLADLVLDIHHRLTEGNLPGDKMDFVYIDEVQDFTMRQICLLRYLCKNVDEGFVFSGDTAQTIARGIDFRFEDIRSLFYNEFFMNSANFQSFGRREKGLISDIVSLSQNFRTHTGVLRLAQSVTDLILYFFPQSIDVLPPETSLIYGEPPIFLEPGSDENSIISIFRDSASAGEKWVGFGADQVILVRNNFEKREIFNYLGHQALILTIVECKGLEFQDVLLYNFFGSSPMSNQWRVLYEYLKENNLLDANSPKSFPNFSPSRHTILCSELKQLYVAITRTRQRLWICENDEEMSKPMLDYWKSLFLVQVRKLDDSLARAMQRASSPEEWKAQGIKLFWEKNYEMATMCFEKAGEDSWEKRAKASGLRAAAYSLRDSNPSEAHTMLREAAELFDSIDRADSAAECFCDLGEYERAGRIYLDKCGVSGLRKAGECFCLAGSYKTAAEVFAKGVFFNDCLSACLRGSLFDLGLQYIELWKQDASWNILITTRLPEIECIAQEYLQKCASDCEKRNDKVMMMKFVGAFDTIDSKRDFLKKLGCLEEILVLEEESGNFNEAVDIARRLGDVPREIDLLVKAGLFENASYLALCYVLSKSQWLPKSFLNKDDLLAKAMSTARMTSKTFYRTVCLESKILSDKQGTVSELMQCYTASKQWETLVGEILSIRKLLDAHVKSNYAIFEWEIEVGTPPSVLDERILRNCLSCSTLFHVWKLWKVKSFEILECLDSFCDIDFSKCDGAVRFCLDYFGVRLQSSSSGKVILLFPNASWCKNVDDRFIVRSGKMVILEARHFSSAARKQWLQEILATGFGALEALKSLYMLSEKKCTSKGIQGLCLTYIFDIAKFLMDSKTFDLKKSEHWKLQDYVMLSVSKNFFQNAFPLDTRMSLSETMINLRETELSKNLLGEIVSMNFTNSRSGLSYGQMGRVAMILMGSGVPNCEVCGVISEGFSNSPSSWKSFVENFVGLLNLQAMSYELYVALDESYNANWMARDYMSPHCFFYLVERLLILVPHSRGYFFVAKSSFIEYLLCLNSDANPSSLLDTKSAPDGGRVTSFVFKLVQQCVTDGKTTTAWIKAACINCKYYFPVLLLRLIKILCLLCLDSDVSFVTVTRLLWMPHIRSQLPRQFCDILCSGRRNDRVYLTGLVAAAFKATGDPLMTVCVDKNCPKNFCPGDGVFIDLRTLATRDEAMRSLYPRRVILVTEQVGSNEGEIDSMLKYEAGVNAGLENSKGNVKEKVGIVDSVGDGAKLESDVKLGWENEDRWNGEGDVVGVGLENCKGDVKEKVGIVDSVGDGVKLGWENEDRWNGEGDVVGVGLESGKGDVKEKVDSVGDGAKLESDVKLGWENEEGDDVGEGLENGEEVKEKEECSKVSKHQKKKNKKKGGKRGRKNK